MHKLTAGIFAGILTIVGVNAAHADIATTNYVQQGVKSAKTHADTEVAKVNTKVGDLTTLTTTDKSNTVAAINEVSGAVVTALANAKAYTDELKNGDVAANKAAIAILNGDVESKDSVDYKIAQAVLDVSSNIKTLDDEVAELKTNKADVSKVYTKTEIDSTVTTINTSIADAKKAGTDASAHADALNTAMDVRMDAAEASITSLTTGENSVASQIDAAKAAIKETTDDLDTRVTANTTAIGTLNGTGAGSVKKAADDAQAAAEAAAKTYTDDEITKVTTAATTLAGRVSAAETDIDALQAATTGLTADKVTQITTNQNAINEITKKDGTIDTKVNAAVTEINASLDGKMDESTALANKLLTTDATSGQLKDASAGLTKPEKCSETGNTCMLVNDGTGFKWEIVVNTYSE